MGVYLWPINLMSKSTSLAALTSMITLPLPSVFTYRKHKHIHMLGRYFFFISEVITSGELRPFRNSSSVIA
ncbi:MAG: hypothetical protein H0U75_06765 [Legionella sp.]|nr:hypothetical protein [Legionella sp.]